MRSIFAALIAFNILLIGLFAETPALHLVAIVNAGPHTTVNGTQVVETMNVFPGQQVETREQLPADIVLKGTALRVLGNSKVEFHESWAELLSGGAIVTTATSFQMKSKCFTAEPAQSKNTRYAVVPDRERILVTAQEGDVILRTKRELRISSGKTAAISACGTPQESTEVLNGNKNLKYILAGAAAGGGAAAIVPMMSGGKRCKPKSTSITPDDCTE